MSFKEIFQLFKYEKVAIGWFDIFTIFFKKLVNHKKPCKKGGNCDNLPTYTYGLKTVKSQILLEVYSIHILSWI